MRWNRPSAATIVIAAALAFPSGCGGGLDAASMDACDNTRRILDKYDQWADPPPEEFRALELETMLPEFRRFAAAATGEVRTAIERLADTIEAADLDSKELISTLRPKLAAFDPKFSEARREVDEACG